MRHPRRNRDQEHGQIIVIAAVAFIIILAFGAIVVDLGLLRNNRQTLVNALDAAALAAGTKLPVDGSSTAVPAGQSLAAKTLIDRTIQANYPGLPTTAYTIEYRCLVGVDPATNNAWVTRDVPAACNPGPSLGWTGSTTQAQKVAAFNNALSSMQSLRGRQVQRRQDHRECEHAVLARPGRRGQERVDRRGRVGGVQRALRAVACPARGPGGHP
jgi:Flp pilus assembly protein TadG